jgi:hypothetical protein
MLVQEVPAANKTQIQEKLTLHHQIQGTMELFPDRKGMPSQLQMIYKKELHQRIIVHQITTGHDQATNTQYLTQEASAEVQRAIQYLHQNRAMVII